MWSLGCWGANSETEPKRLALVLKGGDCFLDEGILCDKQLCPRTEGQQEKIHKKGDDKMKKLLVMLLTMVLAMTLVLPMALPVAAGGGPQLAARWPFNEASGAGTVVDISGNSNDGTVYSATTGEAGQSALFDKAVSFDGTDDYIDCGNKASLSITTPITLEAWIYLDAWSGSWDRVVAKTASWAGGLSYILGISETYRGVYFGLWTGDAQTNIKGQTPIPMNTWTHIAGTWDGSTMRIYINHAVQPETLSFAGPITATTTHLYIGWDGYGQSIHYYQFEGLIDEVRIWRGALTAAQLDDMLPPAIALNPTVSENVYLLNQAVTLSVAESTGSFPGNGVTGVATASPANGSPVDTSTVGPRSFPATATDYAKNTTSTTSNLLCQLRLQRAAGSLCNTGREEV